MSNGFSIDLDAVDAANMTLASINMKLNSLSDACAATGAAIDERVLDQRGIARQLNRIKRSMLRLSDNLASVLRWAESAADAYRLNEYRSAEAASGSPAPPIFAPPLPSGKGVWYTQGTEGNGHSVTQVLNRTGETVVPVQITVEWVDFVSRASLDQTGATICSNCVIDCAFLMPAR